MDEEKKDIFKKHGYALTGEESGVKLCHWISEKLIEGRSCYKEDFYGIDCHRCLQMSPALDVCNQNCLFCWRYQDYGERKEKDLEFDDPEEIVERSIEAQKKLVSGFRGDQRCSEDMWREAREPNQVAISLSGEPSMYPRLGELIEEYEKRGMTTFLVSNGTRPDVLEELEDLPTQLYITLAAPNEEIFKKLCVPNTASLWDRVKESLDLLPSLDTRTVVRHTLVKDWNIGWESEYADLVKRGDPDFIEAKGYVFVGDSRRRMTIDNMPSHDTIKGFAEREADLLGLETLQEKESSRVVLLGSVDSRQKIE
ncbi:MAG: 4-demethylwyosine synthase TYW1 [Candidatus Thermoplasmatota archaeon]|nr:4-demethylwyosine synthase TYW1 [Candidatus Thermoplasmatota archaeon]